MSAASMNLRPGSTVIGEMVALAPGDIQIIVHGECFPAKRLKALIPDSGNGVSGPDHTSPSGFLEVGEWLSQEQKSELQKLMGFPETNPATVFQILVNIPPESRLVCEWPHGCLQEDGYYFTQLADLDDRTQSQGADLKSEKPFFTA